MAALESMRRAFAPHFGHFFVSEAVWPSIFSNWWPHFSHLYSYKGNEELPPAMTQYKIVACLSRFVRAQRGHMAPCVRLSHSLLNAKRMTHQ